MAALVRPVQLEPPRIHLLHMAVFTLVVGVVIAILFRGIERAFMANIGLNSLILGTLLLGIVYAFRMVWRLGPEIAWVNGYRSGLTNAENPARPVLLAPMAAQMGDQEQRLMLSPTSMRSLLDSLAARLDESRDLMRYLVGLLVFLGLLGTFWGLLTTVAAIGDAISALDVSAAQSSTMFDELKTGLQKPLSGMGLSFASSLFGLAGSLILGFYDLKMSQAQNRFYHALEDWLSTITDIEAGHASIIGQQIPSADLHSLQRGLERLTRQLEGRATAAGSTVSSTVNMANQAAARNQDAMEELATAVGGLVQQMREEQKNMRAWAQSQQSQQNEIQQLLVRVTESAPVVRSRANPRRES